ncbi:MAG: hypothetical protein KDA78_07355, partial [Planctomycetaceae bacterium]|nr:hypothetical protein [Planctomycetaceae bacterium]
MARSTPVQPAGYTLIELLVSMVATTGLLLALSSTLMIALQSTNPDNFITSKTVKAYAILADMDAELQSAVSIKNKATTKINFNVPDRSDSDTAEETIEYFWGGTGLPLQRKYNNGSYETLLDSVQSLLLTYTQDGSN